jgi:hypothetical protein
MPSIPANPKPRDRVQDWSAGLFAAAWLIGLAGSIHPERFGFGHGFEMAQIAKNLVERGIFGNPFDPALTGPTAVVPPLYPMFLALLIKVFGWPLPAALIANIGFNAVTAGLMPRLALVFFDDARPGFAAGLLWIAAMPLMPQWDAGFTIACVVLACVFVSGSLANARSPWWHGLAAGALAGIASLLNPVAMIPLFSWIAFRLLQRRTPGTYAVRYLSALLVTVALCNGSWLLRNYGIWHALALRTNFGMTLYSSNNDCAAPSLGEDGRNGCYQRTHPVASAPEVQLLRHLGEVEYDRRRTADAFAWIGSHPSRFAGLTAARIAEFWFPIEMFSRAPEYGIWVATLLSVPGILLMIRRRQSAVWFLLFVWAVYPLVYYIVVASDRYRYPILWTSLLPAGYGLAALVPAVKRKMLGTSSVPAPTGRG